MSDYPGDERFAAEETSRRNEARVPAAMTISGLPGGIVTHVDFDTVAGLSQGKFMLETDTHRIKVDWRDGRVLAAAVFVLQPKVPA